MMLKTVISASVLIAAVRAQDTCPDITQDPHIDLSGDGTGVGNDNLDFERYCGGLTTPAFGYAIKRDTDESNTREANCRVKCKDWDVTVDDEGNRGAKLFWLRTKKRWIRTKWLTCYCKTKNDGSELCKYRRRSYNYKAEGGRDGSADDDVPLKIACRQPGCMPPKDIAEFNTGTLDEVRNTITGDVLCGADCKINTDRGGTWSCFAENGTPIGSDVEVPRRGYCELQCSHQPLVNIKKKMICLYPHKINGADQYKNMWRIYKQLPLNKWRKIMDPINGWQCSAALSDGAIADALNDAINNDEDDADRSLDYNDLEDYESDDYYSYDYDNEGGSE